MLLRAGRRERDADRLPRDVASLRRAPTLRLATVLRAGAVLRFAGKSEDLGAMLGLDRAWAVNIIKQVGNYAESYERNITPLGLERGLNRLWRDGGLLIAPPMR